MIYKIKILIKKWLNKMLALNKKIIYNKIIMIF